MKDLYTTCSAAALLSLLLLPLQGNAQGRVTGMAKPSARAVERLMPTTGRASFHGHDGMNDLRGGPPANDDCSGAITLIPSVAFTPISGDVAGATQSLAAITCNAFTGVADDDVWYQFTASAASMKVRVVGNQYFDAVVDLRSGACNGTNIGCADATFEGEAEQIAAGGLTVGAVYYVRVYSYYDTLPPVTTFSIGVYTGALTAPANDQCGSVTAQSLPVGGSLTFSGDNAAATTTNDYAVGSAFDGTIFPSTWHAFTTTACSNVTLSYCGIAPPFGQIWIVLSPTCPVDDSYIAATTFDFTTCVDGNGTAVFNDLPAGTYYVPVLAEGGNALGAYSILASSTACGAAPSNDECSSVTPVALNVGSSVNFSGDNTGATLTNDAVPGTSVDGTPSVWHAFTLSECANVAVSYCGTTPAFGNVWIVLTTTCPADDPVVNFTTFNDTDCGDGNWTIYYDYLPAGTYYLPVLSEVGSEGPYTIDVAASSCAPPASNDDCTDAINLPLNNPLDCPANEVAGDNGLATHDGNDPACDATTTQFQDVWYTFNSGNNSVVTVDLSLGTIVDVGIEMLDACNGTSIFCDFTALTYDITVDPNTDYWIRLFSNNDFGTGGTYGICLSAASSTGILGSAGLEWSVFPNPGNGDVTLTYTGATANATIDLIDLTGRVVYTERANLVKGATHELRLAGELSQGTYALRVSTANGSTTRNLLVK